MSDGMLQRRGTALEDEFFFRVDQKLVAEYQERQQQVLDEQALAHATGIEDQHVLEELRAADVTPRTLAAFSMFPAVYVAWSDGHVETEERSAILKAARHLGIFSWSPSHDLLGSWLRKHPSDELLAAWKDFIHAIRPTISHQAFQEMRRATMERASEIATAAGGFLGLKSVSAAEKSALAELNAVFDHAVESSKAAT